MECHVVRSLSVTVHLGEHVEASGLWLDVAPAVKTAVTAVRGVFDTLHSVQGR